MILFYLPVAIAGFVVYSNTLSDNITENLNGNWIKTTILVLITGHLLTAFNIILNPVYQGLENFFNAPQSKMLKFFSNSISLKKLFKDFSLKRVFIRLSVLVSVLFVAQSIPHFGPILTFIGGSTVSMSSFILPCIFYVLICRKEQYKKYRDLFLVK